MCEPLWALTGSTSFGRWRGAVDIHMNSHVGLFTCGGDIHMWKLLTCGGDIDMYSSHVKVTHMWKLLMCGGDIHVTGEFTCGCIHLWGYSHVEGTITCRMCGCIHVWKLLTSWGHSHVEVAHLWRGHSCVGVAHVLRGLSRMGLFTCGSDKPPKWNYSLLDISSHFGWFTLWRHILA